MPKRPDAERQEQVLEALHAVAPPILRRYWLADSCIASTRDVIDALRYFRLRAEPLSVKVMIFNLAAWSEVLIHGRLPESVEEREAWWLPVGGHSMGLGYANGQGARENKWPGHLVALVENRWLVDLTLPQASRPERMIHLVPVVFEARAEFLDRKERHTLRVEDAVVAYAPALRGDMQAEGWRQSKDWHDLKRHERPFRDVTTAMTRFLEDNATNHALRHLSGPVEAEVGGIDLTPDETGGLARGGAVPEAGTI